MMANSRSGAHGGAHASTKTYLGVAAVLAVITAIEVMVFYVEALHPVIVPILLTLSGTKFALVVMFFMHLKFDGKLFTSVFVGPLAVAVVIILAMLAMYGLFTSGGAPAG
ncbi:MAG: cytochrome C oxidase subunit IV family protein [Gemmatimonadota bacterium]